MPVFPPPTQPPSFVYKNGHVSLFYWWKIPHLRTEKKIEQLNHHRRVEKMTNRIGTNSYKCWTDSLHSDACWTEIFINVLRTRNETPSMSTFLFTWQVVPTYFELLPTCTRDWTTSVQNVFNICSKEKFAREFKNVWNYRRCWHSFAT